MQSFDAVRMFQRLFQGNHTALGTEEGGCVRIDPDDWELYVEGHLRGKVLLGLLLDDSRIGVYPMVDDRVRWGCIDFDEGWAESLIHAQNVKRLMKALGVQAWIEESRSKGYHVWVFANEWVQAKLMREALLAGCQLVDAPTREINPKQATLPEGSLGNYVRLPYPGVMSAHYLTKSGKRAMRSDEGHVMFLERFLGEAWRQRATIPQLVKLQDLYVPPAAPIVRRDWGGMSLEGGMVERLRGKARIIFENGPLVRGERRGHTLYKLACYLREDGRHTRDEALQLLTAADLDWGKFHDRPDRDRRLQEMVDRAWDKLP